MKTVTIKIENRDLVHLKKANYKLCFAKKVQSAPYNVVWKAYDQYLANNTFSWDSTYKLFGSQNFQKNQKVNPATNQVAIKLGEVSTLNSSGILSPPKTGGASDEITLINNYGFIHPGIVQTFTGFDHKMVSTPIYLAMEPILKGSATLTPLDIVLVWFEQNIETGIMFAPPPMIQPAYYLSTAKTYSIAIDLSQKNSAIRLYKNQQWITPKS